MNDTIKKTMSFDAEREEIKFNDDDGTPIELSARDNRPDEKDEESKSD